MRYLTRACKGSGNETMEDYGIYNVDFGKGEGHEQSNQRPAIIFKTVGELGLYLVIPLTSNLEHLNLPYTVQINRTSSTNLRENSVALVFQLRVVNRTRITSSQIGKIEDYQINKIKTIIKEMLGI